MSVFNTGSVCRCPGCKELVQRGINEHDSQFVAICEACSYPPLRDIDQPEPHVLTESEKASFTKDAGDAVHQETLPERMVRILRELKAETGMPWVALGGCLGCGYPSELSNIISKAANGLVGDRCAQGWIERIERYRADTNAKPARPAAPKAKASAEPKPESPSPAPAASPDSAREMLEEMFGLDFEELTALKPSLELLAVCRRNGITARIIVDNEVQA